MPVGCVRFALAGSLLAILLGGCSDCCLCKSPEEQKQQRKKKTHQPAFDPAEQYPAWAYDAPFYYRPATELGDVGETIPPRIPGGATQYYVRTQTVQLPRPVKLTTTAPTMTELGPRTVVADLAPRIGVFWTDSGGQEWSRAGYFGISQTHFGFPTENDGAYGFRFVGPGIPAAKCTPPRPHVIYHVDTAAPDVVVYVEPNKPDYYVNESITVHWTASDTNLADAPTSISTCWEFDEDEDCEWVPVIYNQAAEGSMAFLVPPHAAGRRFKIRADARDRAGNLGAGLSVPLIVVETSPASQPAPTASEAVAASQPGGTDLVSSLLLKDGELASHTEPESDSVTRTAPVQRNPERIPQRTQSVLTLLPPMSAEAVPPHRHWSSQPWQNLWEGTPDDFGAVWSLPFRQDIFTDAPSVDDEP